LCKRLIVRVATQPTLLNFLVNTIHILLPVANERLGIGPFEEPQIGRPELVEIRDLIPISLLGDKELMEGARNFLRFCGICAAAGSAVFASPRFYDVWPQTEGGQWDWPGRMTTQISPFPVCVGRTSNINVCGASGAGGSTSMRVAWAGYVLACPSTSRQRFYLWNPRTGCAGG
jgi:hypothetical protein